MAKHKREQGIMYSQATGSLFSFSLIRGSSKIIIDIIVIVMVRVPYIEGPAFTAKCCWGYYGPSHGLEK